MSKVDARAAVTFAEASVLMASGGAHDVPITLPGVIAAGTVVRAPASPDTLDFDGYNTLSLKLHVAGLSGDDVLKVYAAASDPTSPTGDPVVDNLSQVLAITADASGDWAGTVNLVSTLQGQGGIVPQTLLPLANTWQGGWGCNVADQSVACQTNDAAASLIQGTTTQPGVSSKLALARPMDPHTNDGWTFNVVAAKLGVDARLIGVSLNLRYQLTYSTPGIGGGVFGGADVVLGSFYLGASRLAPFPSLGPMIENSWDLFTYPISSAIAAQILSLGPGYLVIQPTTDTGFGDPGTENAFPNITQMFIAVPASPAGGGSTPVSIPFYRNLLMFDASACAHDVTVSQLFATLTNSRRRRA